ncbi:MAG: diaminopimelate epimerase [Dehalococcoidales bacterium]|nr:diaminopimelate epimerase [Dehalococcoidales bacterium]
MNFTKMQSVGNDFILVEASSKQYNWPQIARAICHRHFGVGGDGLLLLVPSSAAGFGMRVLNSDGSETEACGNGLRCLAKYVIDQGLAGTGTKEITIETTAGIRKAKLVKEKGKVDKIQVGMGLPQLSAPNIPVAIESEKSDLIDITLIADYPITVGGEELKMSFVSMGNPHAIHFLQSPVIDFPLSRFGPMVEKHELFPNRINFEVARVIGRKEIEVQVWERGVGETLGCGSGACAVAVCAQLLGYSDNKVDIKLPGGILGVEWDGVGEVLLSGPAEIVFTGKWGKSC